MRTVRSCLPALALALVLLGCDGDDADGFDQDDDRSVEASDVVGGTTRDAAPQGDELEAENGGTAGEDEAGDATDAEDGERDGSDGSSASDLASDPAPDDASEGNEEPVAEPDTSHLADLTRAEPGIWPVGNAGTVTFDLEGRNLVLRDIDGAAGWSIEVAEDERDEIEVAFHRDDVRWRLQAERSGRDLQLVIEQRIHRADTGGYDLGDAGTFAFDVVDGRLVLTSLELADGWEVRDRDEGDEDIELDLRADGRRVEVEVELDGRTVELDISYRVRNRFR